MEPACVNSLADVFRVVNEMRQAGIVENCAVGGAMAMLFYAEPTRTYDLDVFVMLPEVASSTLVSLDSWQLLESGEVDRALLKAILARHNLSFEIPDGL